MAEIVSVGVRRAAKRELLVFSAALDIPDRLRHVKRGRAHIFRSEEKSVAYL